MQDNTKVVGVLGLAGVVLGLMGVGVWLVLRDDPSPSADTPINPIEDVTMGQIEMAEHAVGVSGIIEPGIERFHLRMGRYPVDLIELSQAPRDAEEARQWRGPYINNANLLNDPWGKSYRIRVPGTHHEGRYDLWSAGPDGQDNTADDIGNW